MENNYDENKREEETECGRFNASELEGDKQKIKLTRERPDFIDRNVSSPKRANLYVRSQVRDTMQVLIGLTLAISAFALLLALSLCSIVARQKTLLDSVSLSVKQSLESVLKLMSSRHQVTETQIREIIKQTLKESLDA